MKPGFELINVTKGHNSAKKYLNCKTPKYAPGNAMTKLL